MATYSFLNAMPFLLDFGCLLYFQEASRFANCKLPLSIMQFVRAALPLTIFATLSTAGRALPNKKAGSLADPAWGNWRH